jgi:hypothetical protein
MKYKTIISKNLKMVLQNKKSNEELKIKEMLLKTKNDKNIISSFVYFSLIKGLFNKKRGMTNSAI